MQYVRPLILPPTKPPAQFSTMAFSVVSILLAGASVFTVVGASGFPGNAPIEALLAWFSAFILYVGAATTAAIGLIQELFRKRYKEVVTRYATVTGDTRYLPYISRTYIPVVASLSAIAFLAPPILFFIPDLLSSFQNSGGY